MDRSGKTETAVVYVRLDRAARSRHASCFILYRDRTLQLDAVRDLTRRRDCQHPIAEVIRFLDQLEFVQKSGNHSRQFVILRIRFNCVQDLANKFNTVPCSQVKSREDCISIRLARLDFQRRGQFDARPLAVADSRIKRTKFIMDSRVNRIEVEGSLHQLECPVELLRSLQQAHQQRANLEVCWSRSDHGLETGDGVKQRLKVAFLSVEHRIGIKPNCLRTDIAGFHCQDLVGLCLNLLHSFRIRHQAGLCLRHIVVGQFHFGIEKIRVDRQRAF